MSLSPPSRTSTAPVSPASLCIAGDPTHPTHSFFSLLPSGRRLRSLQARTNRLKDSFIHQAVRKLNSLPSLPPSPLLPHAPLNSNKPFALHIYILHCLFISLVALNLPCGLIPLYLFLLLLLLFCYLFFTCPYLYICNSCILCMYVCMYVCIYIYI